MLVCKRNYFVYSNFFLGRGGHKLDSQIIENVKRSLQNALSELNVVYMELNVVYMELNVIYMELNVVYM